MSNCKRAVIGAVEALLCIASAVGLAQLVLSCHPLPSTVTPDGSLDAAAPSAVHACARLAELGCEEGIDAKCTAVVEHVLASRLTPFDTACVSSASSVAAVKQCPAIRCAQDGGAP